MKLRIILPLLFLAIGVASSQAGAVEVARYTFDDGTFNDSVGTFHGTPAGNATIVNDPVREMVLSLDGNGDYVDIPATAGAVTEFTIAMWIYANVDLTGTQFAGGLNTDSWDDQGVHFKLNYGRVNVGLQNSPSGDAAGTTVIPLNTWTHIAVTLAANGDYRVYYNGQEEGSQSPGAPVTANLAAANIGSWNASRYLNGRIDEVRIFNHALTGAEVAKLMLPPPATDPTPEHESTVLANTTTTLSWTNSKNTNSCDVYFGKEDVALDVNGDPNRVRMDKLTFGPPVESVAIDDFESYATPLTVGKYYWVVDCNVPGFLVEGDMWEFNVAANVAPVAEAGDSIVTWLEAAQAGFALNGSATDENGSEDIVSTLWEVVSTDFPLLPGPDVSFADAGELDTTVTIGEVGEYILTLTVTDTADHQDTDAMKIIVYGDACEAAQNNPEGYTPLAYDFNSDCQEDLLDFAMFAEKWLEANFLTENVSYDAGALFTGSDLLLWLDASDTATLTIVNDQVSRWDDKADSGRYLVAGGTAGDPNYVAAGLNGQGIVDLGPYMPDQSGNWALGKWMQFKNPQGANLDLNTIRTVFWVLKGSNHLLTDNNSYHFHRGGGESATSNIWAGYASANIRSGETYLNGQQVDGTATPLPADYSVVSLVTTGNVEASTLCSDRNQYRSGGQKIAEIIIFNRPLDGDERQIIENYLKTKWGL
ncbi:MAG: LamG domain-containing protein [Sedimentisphaerales bacterium]|nr:LamG domain-containing protein [Sedimentisphaerales bacterium]